MKHLNNDKVSQVSDIDIKGIKGNVDIFADLLCKNTFKSSLFSSYLKSADMNPLYKNVKKKDLQENNRPVSILWTLSKVFGRIMFAQMSKFFDKILSRQHAIPGKAIVQKNTYCPSNKIGNMPFIGIKRSVLY